MVRAVLVPVIFCGLVVLTSFATTPPNLERTLEAQRELVSQNPYDAQSHNDLGNLLMLAATRRRRRPTCGRSRSTPRAPRCASTSPS